MTSGVTLLGVPTDIYSHGTQYIMHVFTEVLVCIVTAWLFVPVYYNLQVATTYEVFYKVNLKIFHLLNHNRISVLGDEVQQNC
jgi:Na+/proline symporter